MRYLQIMLLLTLGFLTGCTDSSSETLDKNEIQISETEKTNYLSKEFDGCDLTSPEETWKYWDVVLSSEDKDRVKTQTKTDLILFHHGWGTGIRNELCLWKGGPLQKWFLDRDVSHPDEMSMILIELYWSKLNGCNNCPKNVTF